MNREVICFDAVAPVRERGLKYHVYNKGKYNHGRSREGARIEILKKCLYPLLQKSRSREGARIEI